MKKPTKPTETLPSSFGGIKENFTDDKQATGYEPDVPDILGGANLNYTIDTIGKKDIYHDAINDFVNATPIDNTITVDSNNDLVYEDISNIVKYESIPESIPTTEKCILINRKGTYLTPYSANQEGVGWRLFDTKFSDHVLTGDEATGWALLGTYTLTTDTKFYDACVAEKEAAGDAKEIEVENGYSFTGYENKNGHIYYDISEKANVDQIYNVTGSAWFYGIDTTNKRIFLPRNDNFVQSSGNTTKVGNFVEHGLPSHTHNVPVTGSTTTSTAGASYSGTTGRVLTSGGVVTSEPDNTIYGNSDTVQPRAIRQLCYMCVGNVIINEDEIDVETLVGDVRNKANIDLDNLSDTGEARFTEKANIDLSNLSSTGEAKFTAKLDKSNVVSKGSATVPVYFNSSGVATTITSYSGNSATATKATQDASGNVITSTYLTKTDAAGTYANQSLSNLNDTGLDKINQSKALETGDVSTDSDVYSDIQKYRHSTFDLSKFTVVGSPTITDDGIASGFSGNDYLTIPNSENIDLSKPHRFYFNYKRDSYTSGVYRRIIRIGTDNYVVNVEKQQTTGYNIRLSLTSGSEKLSISTPQLLYGISYDGYYEWDGSKYSLYYKT